MGCVLVAHDHVEKGGGLVVPRCCHGRMERSCARRRGGSTMEGRAMVGDASEAVAGSRRGRFSYEWSEEEIHGRKDELMAMGVRSGCGDDDWFGEGGEKIG